MKKEGLKINEPKPAEKIIVNVLLILLAVSIIIPVWNTFAISFSTDMDSYEQTLKLLPRQFSLQGYVTLMQRIKIWKPFLNTVIVTVIGVFLHLVVNTMAAFVLTRPCFRGKGFLVLFFLIPLMIPGESIIIPRYIVMKSLGIIDTLWSVILNNVANTFSIFLLYNYFLSIPRSLEESAEIDGAGPGLILQRIYLPLSTAGLATITLLEMVGKWNTLFSAVLYINSPQKYMLQQALKTLVIHSESPFTSGLSVANNAKAAGILIALLPVLFAYPFLQKYFIKGVFLGSIKE